MPNLYRIGENPLPKDKSYADFDTLGFNPARGVFIKVIEAVTSSLTVGLYGAWGSGKSTMITGIVEQLEIDGYLTLIFDAWKYRSEKNLILPLLCALQRKHLSKPEDAKDSVGKVVSSIAVAALSGYIRNKTGIEIGDIRSTMELYENGYEFYKKYDDFVFNVEKEYKAFLKNLLGKNSKQKLVIVVDNLDRCLPDTVVNLLEDIASFLSIGDIPCVYVLAMDKENVIKAIQHRYPDFDAAHYLEKIVQVGLAMPQIESLEAWLGHFQHRISLDRHGNSSLFGFDKKLVLHELNKISGVLCKGGLLGNPRRIERFVNNYFLLLAMGGVSHAEKVENISSFIFAFLLKERFPDVYLAIKDERDERFLLGTLFGWARDPGNVPERVLKDSQREGAYKIPNIDLFRAYTGDKGFHKFLQMFTLPLPGDSIGLLEIKKKLDLIG